MASTNHKTNYHYTLPYPSHNPYRHPYSTNPNTIPYRNYRLWEWGTLGMGDPRSGGPWDWRALGMADSGSGGPWEWRTLGVADPGDGGPWEWRTLGMGDPGSGGPWEWRTNTRAATAM